MTIDEAYDMLQECICYSMQTYTRDGRSNAPSQKVQKNTLKVFKCLDL